MVMVQMEAQPNNEPHIPYSSHIKGPAHKEVHPAPYNGTDKTTKKEKKLYNYVVILNKLFLSK
jgi:hypothetical protein